MIARSRLAFTGVFSAIVLAASPANACPGPGLNIFLEDQVHYLPRGAVQFQIAVDAEPEVVSGYRVDETSGTIINVVNSSPEFVLLGSTVTLDLRMPGTSCYWPGIPSSEMFVVGFVRQAASGDKIHLRVEPVFYTSQRFHRSYAEELETARLYDER